MNSKSTILLVLLLASLGYNYYLYERCENNMMAPDKGACDNTKRYSQNEELSATEISFNEAKTIVEQYRNDFPADQLGNPPTGYILSKRIFDSIFDSLEINSVTLDFVTYQEKKALVVRGMITDSTKVDGSVNSGVYVLKCYCPFSCSSW